MKQTHKSLSFDDATFPPRFEIKPSADVQAWQAEQVAAGLKEANEGRFSTPEELQAVIRKFVPND